MRIIDLLNKIANDDKVPKKIRIRGFEFIVGEGSSIENYYLLEETDESWLNAIDIRLYDEVEIIEDNKNIKEIEITKDNNCKRFIEYDDNTGHHKYVIRVLDEYFATKINEVVKEINKQKNNEEVL